MKEKLLDYNKDWQYIKNHLEFLESDEEREAFLRGAIIAHTKL